MHRYFSGTRDLLGWGCCSRQEKHALRLGPQPKQSCAFFAACMSSARSFVRFVMADVGGGSEGWQAATMHCSPVKYGRVKVCA